MNLRAISASNETAVADLSDTPAEFYNLIGIKVDKEYKGVVIVHYTNGKTEKKVLK